MRKKKENDLVMMIALELYQQKRLVGLPVSFLLQRMKEKDPTYSAAFSPSGVALKVQLIRRETMLIISCSMDSNSKNPERLLSVHQNG